MPFNWQIIKHNELTLCLFMKIKLIDKKHRPQIRKEYDCRIKRDAYSNTLYCSMIETFDKMSEPVAIGYLPLTCNNDPLSLKYLIYSLVDFSFTVLTLSSTAVVVLLTKD
ncbi:hypothetical protein RF11_02440 [Thelohanellus kitauei]|uniref:Uncharacterized protein n=1 Tax=Thelohanellus kitauei TaxID=669202 RepID=A0A0C2MXA0_THEKT|nr:hypothetical protein RF11_02440 [Thelohanellus kitauei]